ncbi:MAG: response regulator transcription factor [Candidatus Promineifilaceae bacterium]|nr:response regulator transcription factor [Candidatus Promineifilaceae bacterium]
MKVLVVDDDRVLAEIMVFTLQRAGFDVIQAYDGQTALQRWEAEAPDLLVLDVNLPDMDGFTICRHIRESDGPGADIPIILLTVRSEEDDIVHGLEIGADDYITKPYSPRQLVARVQAVLRRAGGSASETVPGVRRVGALTLDHTRREVQVGEEEPVLLTPLEMTLLDYLMLNPGHVLTTDTLIDRVWGPGGGTRNMLRQLVHRLRNKIEPDPSDPIYVETVPGLGYGLVKESGLSPR